MMMMSKIAKKVASKPKSSPVTEESFFLEDTILTDEWMEAPIEVEEEELALDGQLAVDVYETAMTFHDRERGRESKSCSVTQGLRRKERVEYALDRVGSHSSAGVLNRDLHVAARRGLGVHP